MVVAPSESVAAANKELVRLIKDNPVAGWDDAWKAGATPWDSGVVPSVTSSGRMHLIFIPGCGRGYDATFIASQIWVLMRWPSIYHQQQFKLHASKALKGVFVSHLNTIDLGVPSAKVLFEVADFSISDDQLFSLIYTYT